MKKVGFIIVGLLMTLVAVAQEIAVEQKIDSIAILIGQQAHMTVGVTAKKGQRVVFPQFKRTQQITPGVEVLESTPADTTSLDNGMMKVQTGSSAPMQANESAADEISLSTIPS